MDPSRCKRSQDLGVLQLWEEVPNASECDRYALYWTCTTATTRGAMNAAERQALREKHKCCSCGYCLSDECYAGCVGAYPCDVIKVLDATENLKFSDLKTEVECDHADDDEVKWTYYNYTFCPKCGEKL